MTFELRWTPFFSLLNREIKRFRKVLVQTVVAPLINSTMYLLIFGVSLGASIEMGGDVSYLAFLIPGLVMMGCLNNAFQNSSSSVTSGKFGGDLEDYRVAPLSKQQIVWAFAFGGLVRGFIVGAITFLVGQIFYYTTTQQFLGLAHPGWLLYFLTVGGLAFSTLGLSVAFWAKTIDQISAVGSFVLLPLIYLGGVFFTLDQLHPFWRNLSQFNPLLYMINGVRYGVLGVSDVNVYWAAFLSAFSLLIFHLVALKALRAGAFTRW